MKQFHRYSYWLTKGGYIVNNRHGEDNPKSAGDIFLGAWYAHENTPYIRKNGTNGRCKSCLFAERLVEIIIAENVSCAKPYMPDEI